MGGRDKTVKTKIETKYLLGSLNTKRGRGLLEFFSFFSIISTSGER
jgi:hypothetical protein